MRVRFLRRFRWIIPERGGRVAIVFKAGSIRIVRRVCGEAAIAAGAAVETTEGRHEPKGPS